MTEGTLQSAVREEIEALHRFFVGWFSGEIPESDAAFQKGFRSRFDDKFLLIPPAGLVLDLSQLESSIRAGHANNPEFRIAIRNVTVRQVFGDFLLATYEEWQRNALASTPPDNGRIASVVFQTGHRLRWIHVHETWMPKEVMAAGPYDF